MEALGIDLRTLIFQLINFGLLLLLLTKLLHKPLMKLLDDRQREISKGLDDAAKAKEQLEAAEARQAEILAEADKRAQALIAEVREQGKSLQAQLEEQAQLKAEALIQRAEQEMKAEREEFRQQMRGELADMVIDTTAKVLRNEKLKADKQGQIKELVDEVENRMSTADNIAKHIIQYLKDEGHYDLLPEVADHLLKEANRQQEITVISAEPLDKKAQDELKATLVKRWGEHDVVFTVDPILISGFVVSFQDTVMDFSGKFQLQQLKQTLE